MKLYLLPQADIDLAYIKTEFTQQQQQAALVPHPQKQQQRAKIFMVKQSATLLDCIRRMPVG